MRKPTQERTHVNATIALYGLALFFCLLVFPANAQAACGARDGIVEKLASQYSETIAARAVGADGAAIEIYASPGGSWTMLATYPAGSTCVLSSGEGWETHEIEPGIRAMMKGRRQRLIASGNRAKETH